MSKQYFVWKDPNCNGINPEWLELGAMEFYHFVNRPENKGRHFVTLGDDGEEEAGILVLEATLDVYKDWHKKSKAAARRASSNAAYKRVVVSLYDYIPESENLTYEDVIPSDDESVEDLALKELDFQMLRDVLKTLSDEEMEIINALYLYNHEELSERAIAKKLGLPQKSLNNIKRRIFKKIKKSLAQKGASWGN